MASLVAVQKTTLIGVAAALTSGHGHGGSQYAGASGSGEGRAGGQDDTHQQFASKADVEELRKLVGDLTHEVTFASEQIETLRSAVVASLAQSKAAATPTNLEAALAMMKARMRADGLWASPNNAWHHERSAGRMVNARKLGAVVFGGYVLAEYNDELSASDLAISLMQTSTGWEAS